MFPDNAGSHKAVIVVVLMLLATGAVLRFANLDQKVYGHDETITLVRVAGFTRAELKEELFNGREIGIEEMQKFQRPNAERNLADTVKSLATSVPQHTPLYFITARSWAEWFGNSPAATKTLPALLSLFIFPCVYWLCRELFNSSFVGWIAMGLVAVSPFHLLYAQEARPYSLLSLVALLSSSALLRALRVQTRPAWIAYAATVTLGLYSQLLFGLVWIGHGIYVMAIERLRITSISLAYGLSAAVALTGFAPWLVIIGGNFSKVESSMSHAHMALPISSMVKAWAGDLGRIFVDSGRMGFELRLSNLASDFNLAVLLAFNLAAIVTALYAVWFVRRTTPKRVWLFILTLIGIASLPLVASDLILGRRVSTAGRYLLPAYFGIQIAMAYLFAIKIKSSSNVWRRRIWQQIGLLVAAVGVVSCVYISQAPVSWNHSHVYHHPSVARIINGSTQPLLISDGDDMDIFSLSYLLRPETRFQLFRGFVPAISNPDRDIFLYRPSQALMKEVQKTYELVHMHQLGNLWQAKKRSEVAIR